MLAVNTPFDGVTVEASNPKNTGTITEHTEKFVADIKRYLKQGKAVAVADIAYGNGADNAWSENCLKKKWQKSLLLTVVGILLEILWDLLWDKDYCQKVWIRLIFNLCWK